jgi:chromosome partitioning protein
MINLKGGVAKTTNAVAIAECLACRGYRTLLIDADHQCMAGELLLGEDLTLRCERSRTTLHDMLAAMLGDEFEPELVASYIIPKVSDIGGGIETLSVLPCSIRIDDFSTNMAKARRGHHSNDEFLSMMKKRRGELRKWLAANFDFTIVDCPPSLAIQVKFLLSVGDSFVVPSIPDRLSVRGSLFLMERIQKLGFKIQGLGTLWSLYRAQAPLHRRFIELGAEGAIPFNRLPPPFETVIPNAAKIAETTEPNQKPVSFRAKYSAEFARRYEELCNEIIARSQPVTSRRPEKFPAINLRPATTEERT